ncbi:hypothetical protein TCAL_15817, partial [Tigriopus californicus]
SRRAKISFLEDLCFTGDLAFRGGVAEDHLCSFHVRFVLSMHVDDLAGSEESGPISLASGDAQGGILPPSHDMHSRGGLCIALTENE